MIKANNILIAFLISAVVFSFGVNRSISQVTDIDDNVYKTVIIGNQEWTAENLNVEHYRNGDLIPEVQDSALWANLTTGAWCYYENNSEYGKIYSKLYNWYAMNDPRALTPKEWHIPSAEEWTKLTDYLGGEEVAGGKLKATMLWEASITGVTNESGFSAFPGGLRISNGEFESIGHIGCFWSSSKANGYDLWARFILYGNRDVHKSVNFHRDGLSVRCVSDKEINLYDSLSEEKYQEKIRAESSYDYSKHSDFQSFWIDFKDAIKSSNKFAVLKMTNIPFKDENRDIYDQAYGSSRSLTSKNSSEFLNKFDNIFSFCVHRAIKTAQFKSLGKTEFENFATDGIGIYPFGNGNYLLDVECGEPNMFIFEKIEGVYKLTSIPYQE